MNTSTIPANRGTLLDQAYELAQTLERRLQHAIRGREAVIDLLLTALLADGHVLLEDYPGSGKTTLAKALGDSIEDDQPHDEIVAFRRIQFTPDLLPSDITGVTVFDPDTGSFSFRPGPLFAHIVLADEINRTSPKVQAAMLEAMAEKQVTVDNVSHPLDELFFVVATQNPRDQAGTYPLPVAQHDRFLFKIRMDYIEREAELDVLRSARERRQAPGQELPRVSRSAVVLARRTVESFVHVDERIHTCLVDMARSIRESPHVTQGVSTRSLVLMLPALQACALKRGRDYVTAEDVAYLAPFVFAHRMELAPGIDDASEVIRECTRPAMEILTRSTLR
ncbi:MoxR family ATPase [Methanocorpusculum sp. GPch4]|uniref:AAA family ATPase n=1 Tax=Methanocorpusculum sp. GPch4 TaxID=2527877 RepID=UPI001432E229|nr:AAA family ATPase [Methanocorpusculum sp. GPch4]